jgi:hypothetical protein
VAHRVSPAVSHTILIIELHFTQVSYGLPCDIFFKSCVFSFLCRMCTARRSARQPTWQKRVGLLPSYALLYNIYKLTVMCIICLVQDVHREAQRCLSTSLLNYILKVKLSCACCPLQDVHREAQREAANVARRDERGGRGGAPDRMGGRDRGGPGGYGGGPPGTTK